MQPSSPAPVQSSSAALVFTPSSQDVNAPSPDHPVTRGRRLAQSRNNGVHPLAKGAAAVRKEIDNARVSGAPPVQMVR